MLSHSTLCTIFAQCLWSSSLNSEMWKLITWNLGKIFKIKLCQCWSLHGFQTLHFICKWFGCKLLLQSIQNHSRHSFPTFQCSHLKWQYCLIRILRRCPFQGQALDSIQKMQICSFALCLLRDQWMIERLSKAMRSAASIRTFRFVSMPYVYSEIKEW